MRCVARAVVATIFIAGVSGAANAACNGTLATKTGPTGTTLQVCLDGKYTTCLRDSQRLGWAAASAQRHCDNLKAQGRVK